MKKNLISVVILALLIVNIVLSAITMFSVVSTNKKTASLVTDVAAAINLDLKGTDEETKKTVPMADVVTYDISEMVVPLKRGENDDKDHVVLLSVTLSMDSKSKDYKTYGEGDLSARESLIRGEINDVISQYTMDEARDRSHAFEEEILQRIQTMFDSDFIYNVTISSTIYQ